MAFTKRRLDSLKESSSFFLPIAITVVIMKVCLCASPASAEPDFEAEGRRCGRVDLRPWLEKVGVPLLRHQGGRLDSASFLITEAASLVVKKPLSARSLEHQFDRNPRSLFEELTGEQPSREFKRALAQPVCLETEVPSEDFESTRQARLRLIAQALQGEAVEMVGLSALTSFRDFFQSKAVAGATDSPRACLSPPVRLPKFVRTTDRRRLSDVVALALDQNRMPLLVVTSGDSVSVQGVVARRLSVESGRCEFLIREFRGSFCESNGASCEDGSVWIYRDDVFSRTRAVWSAR